MTYLAHITTDFFDAEGNCLGFVADPVCIPYDNLDDAKKAIEVYIKSYLTEPTANGISEEGFETWLDESKCKEMGVWELKEIPQSDYDVLEKYLPVAYTEPANYRLVQPTFN